MFVAGLTVAALTPISSKSKVYDYFGKGQDPAIKLSLSTDCGEEIYSTNPVDNKQWLFVMGEEACDGNASFPGYVLNQGQYEFSGFYDQRGDEVKPNRAMDGFYPDLTSTIGADGRVVFSRAKCGFYKTLDEYLEQLPEECQPEEEPQNGLQTL